MDTPLIFEFYLFHGLALFAASFAIFFKKLSISRMPIAQVLPYLALFCLLRGGHEWFELYRVMFTRQTLVMPSLATFQTLELGLSMGALALLGWKLIDLFGGRWVQAVHQALLVLIGLFFGGAAYHFNTLNYLEYLREVNLHMQWLFGLAGGLTAGWALMYYGARFRHQGDGQAWPFVLLGGALTIYTLSIGALRIDAFSLDTLTTDALTIGVFAGAWGADVIVIRTVGALLLLVATYAALRVFDEEYRQLATHARQASLPNQQLAALGELTSAIAHELKTPLSSALMSCDILSRQLQQPAQEADQQTYERQVNRIRQALLRAAHISQEVLNYAHQNNLKRDDVLLSEVITSALSLNYFRLKDFTVETNLDAQLHIQGDAGLIEQVLTNILGNAIDASGADKHISIDSFPNKNNAVIQIADRAGGVPNAQLEKMMQPFFTTKPMGEGTGMGLAICKKIVLQHGGEISVTNNPHGLTVEVQLPRKRS